MSVQFLEARACQRHDLGEPVFGDGVLSMIVVPRRFTPCGKSFNSLIEVQGFLDRFSFFDRSSANQQIN